MFLLRIIILSLFCVALREARADVKGIPFDAAFPTARFPHARHVSGCTSWRLAEGHKETWGAVSFSGACQEHDRCYHTLGTAWGECNQRFLRDLRQACERDLQVLALTEELAAGSIDGHALQACLGVAEMYAARVQGAAALKRYDLAQKQERAYLSYVEGVIDDVFKEVLGRAATPPEVARSLSLLKGGLDLEGLRKSLAGSPEMSASTAP